MYFVNFFWLCVLAISSPLGSNLVKGNRFRIISGRNVTTKEFPYVVRLERRGRQYCCGSIITPKVVLSAAHCVKAFEDQSPIPEKTLIVRVGSDWTTKGGKVHKIEKVIPHKDYVRDADMDQYDIALVIITDRFIYSDRIQPIKLATIDPQEGVIATVAGYGRQEKMRSSLFGGRHLQAVDIPILHLPKCRKILQGVADDMICAGGKDGRDACVGDSGGPLVVKDTLVGVVAWGIGCGRVGLPGVYSSVAYYKNWIIGNLNRLKKRRRFTSF